MAAAPNRFHEIEQLCVTNPHVFKGEDGELLDPKKQKEAAQLDAQRREFLIFVCQTINGDFDGPGAWARVSLPAGKDGNTISPDTIVHVRTREYIKVLTAFGACWVRPVSAPGWDVVLVGDGPGAGVGDPPVDGMSQADRIEGKLDQLLHEVRALAAIADLLVKREAPIYRAPVPTNPLGVSGQIILTPDKA